MPVDVRILAATHVPLEEAIAQRRFREDLFYRLNQATLVIPPLQERPTIFPSCCDISRPANRLKWGSRSLNPSGRGEPVHVPFLAWKRAGTWRTASGSRSFDPGLSDRRGAGP